MLATLSDSAPSSRPRIPSALSLPAHGLKASQICSPVLSRKAACAAPAPTAPFAPNSACNVYAIYPGFGEVGYTSQGYPVLTTSNYLRVRFSVSGLSFTSAAVYIQARSYATAASTYFDIWSPLYGGLNAGPVDNDWVYDWYGVDWTGFLHPSDSPSLTAIQIYGAQGSGKLAVRAVELCVQ